VLLGVDQQLVHGLKSVSCISFRRHLRTN
jgi:hypothetical protein